MTKLTFEEFLKEYLDCVRSGGQFYPDGSPYEYVGKDFREEYSKMKYEAESIVEDSEDPVFADIADFDDAFDWVFKAYYEDFLESAKYDYYYKYCENEA